MYKDIILNFVKQLEIGANAASDFPEAHGKRIVSCGMGGSRIPGAMLSLFRSNIIIHPDYGLPNDTSGDDFVVCTSWSGNTEETISSMHAAHMLGVPCVVVTKGGVLGQNAAQLNIPVITLPDDTIQPRWGVGYMLGALCKMTNTTPPDISRINTAGLEQYGKEIAEEHNGTIPIMYASRRFYELASFWKILFNENAQTHAFASQLPVAVHNELGAYDSKRKEKFSAILFTDQDAPETEKRNLNAMLAIFKELGYNNSIVSLSSDMKMSEKALENYILGLWVTSFIAQSNGVEPEKTPHVIEKFKELKKKK